MLALETYHRLHAARRGARQIPWCVLVKRDNDLALALKLVDGCETLRVDARDAVQATFDAYLPEKSAQVFGVVSPPFKAVIARGPQYALQAKGARLERGQSARLPVAHDDVAAAIAQTDHLLGIVRVGISADEACATILGAGLAEPAWISAELLREKTDIDVVALRGVYSPTELREVASLLAAADKDPALRKVLRRGVA